MILRSVILTVMALNGRHNAFLDVTTSSLEEVCRRFEETYCLHLQLRRIRRAGMQTSEGRLMSSAYAAVCADIKYSLFDVD
jgi:hypothetical protein